MSAPTKFKPGMCETTIDLMSLGASKTQVANDLSVCRKTLYNWSKTIPSFAEAIEFGETASQAYWEKMMRLAAVGELKGAKTAALIYVMKNRFPNDWREQKHITRNVSSVVSAHPKNQGLSISQDNHA